MNILYAKLIKVRFSPKDTRFRIKPKLLNYGYGHGFYYPLYSFLGCRWSFEVPITKFVPHFSGDLND